MPKSSKIRWKSSDRELLRKTVSRFNSKLKRIVKKDPGATEYLPSPITYEDLKANIKTRADLNREVNKYQRFSRRGAERMATNENGVQTTQWLKREVGIEVGIINRKRNLQRKDKREAVLSGTYKSTKTENLAPKKYDFENMTRRNWDKFVKNVERQVMSDYDQEKLEAFKRNYIQGIRAEDGLGTSEFAKDLEEIVKMIPAKELFEAVQNDPRLEINFMYSLEEVYNRMRIMRELLMDLFKSIEV